MRSKYLIRPIQATDFDAIMAIQAACYPADFVESTATLAKKQQLSPATTWLIECEQQILGYLFSHPWHGELPPALNHELSALPVLHDRFYLHDLAIHPAGRGMKLGEQLLNHALAWAQDAQFSQVMLVAVLGAAPFWQKHHFQTMHNPALKAYLRDYGDAATCMLRQLQASSTSPA